MHAGDVAVPATGEAAVKTAVEHFGRLDVLFNNAGIFDLKPILEVTEAEFDRFLGIILKSKLFVAQAAAKAMKASGRGGRSSDQLHVGTERRFLRLTTPRNQSRFYLSSQRQPTEWRISNGHTRSKGTIHIRANWADYAEAPCRYAADESSAGPAGDRNSKRLDARIL